MNYRFLKFAAIYPEHVRQFVSNNPDYDQLSYKELYDRYVSTRFLWSNFFAKHLGTMGNEAQDLFPSIEPLQKAWAREHGTAYSRKNWLKEIVLAQVKAFQPDVMFFQDLYVFDYAFRQQLREACVNPVILMGYRASPTEDYSAFKDLDVVFTCVPNFAERLRQNGCNVQILKHAFEASNLDAIKPTPERDLDFTFVGSLVLRDDYHYQRYEIVEKLMRSTPLQMWGYISEPPPTSKLGHLSGRLSYEADRSLQMLGVPLKQRDGLLSINQMVMEKLGAIPPSKKNRFPNIHKPVYGLENLRVLARSKITFNSHIDCAEDYAGNMRLFEATGMGACLITDSKVNLPELFEPDTEVVTYSSAEECVAKVNYLLEHPDERRSIAEAGQRRTLRNHTLRQRVAQLDEIIQRMLAGRVN